MGKARLVLDGFGVPAWVSTWAKAEASPIQDGVEGWDSGAIWIVTEERVIREVTPPGPLCIVWLPLPEQPGGQQREGGDQQTSEDEEGARDVAGRRDPG